MSTTQMLDICNRLSTNTLCELRTATVAFLADHYEDGMYIADSDDILDLQKATIDFFENHTDAEYPWFDPANPGLLLPGEQLLLPIEAAVSRVRPAFRAATDINTRTNACIDGQPSDEDALNLPVHDVASRFIGTTEARDKIILTTESDKLTPAADLMDQPLLQVSSNHEFEDFSNTADKIRQLSGLYMHSDENHFHGDLDAGSVDVVTNLRALCCFQAPNVIIGIKGGHSQLAHVFHQSSDALELKDDQKMEDLMCVRDNVYRRNQHAVVDACSRCLTRSSVRPPGNGELDHIAHLPSLWEDNLSFARSLMDDSRLLDCFNMQRDLFADYNATPSQDRAGYLESYFIDEIWTKNLELDLVLLCTPPPFTKRVSIVQLHRLEHLG